MESPKTNKWWTLVPIEELTEDQVREWFGRLRYLHFCDIKHIQWLKEQRKKLNIEKQELIHENAVLRKEIQKLHEEKNKSNKKLTKEEIKQRFLDSL